MKDFSSLAPQKYEFKYLEANYVAHSASAGAVKQYREAGLGSAEMIVDDDTGRRTMKGLIGAATLEPLLVSMCTTNGDGTSVGLDAVQGTAKNGYRDGWPHALVKVLFDWIHSVSAIDENDDLPGLIKQRDDLTKRIDKIEKAGEALKN